MYDPALGRFLSPDPYVQLPDFSQNFNRYSYALNNPLKFTDPDGEFIFTILAAFFAPPLVPAAMQLDIGWITGGSRAVSQGESFWSGAGKGLLTGGINAGTSFINVPGMIPNGALHAGGNVLGNGITNSIYGQDFFDGAEFQALSGFAGGAYSGYQLAKAGDDLNYWWGNEIKYGRTQWSFFTSEKPYETIEWNIRNVGSKKANDCVATTFTEADDYFSGPTSYEDYLSISNYEEGIGTLTTKAGYQKMLSEQFNYNPIDPAALVNPQNAKEVLSKGYLINTNMPHSGVRHADNLRRISYYHSGKVVLKYRIGSFKLRSINDTWWFYLLRELR